jgi:hypothetical protein
LRQNLYRRKDSGPRPKEQEMRLALAVVLLVPLAFAARANESGETALKTTVAATASAIPSKQAEALFKGGRDPLPEIMMRQEQESRAFVRGACDANATSLCYDLADRRVVYRPARQYMPEVEGLRAESVSLRRNTLVFKYSFR